MITIRDRVKNSRAWHISDFEIFGCTYAIMMSIEPLKREKERDQDMDHLKSSMHILSY